MFKPANRDDIHNVLAEIESLIVKPNYFSDAWLQTHDWVVVPIPDSLTEIDAQRVADTANATGHFEGIAVCLEWNEDSVYYVPFNKEAVLDFEDNFSLTSFVIVPKDLSFALLKDEGFYWLIAGMQPFINKVFDNRVDLARQEFWDYATNSFWPENLREILISVSDRYG